MQLDLDALALAGSTIIPQLLDQKACKEIANFYATPAHFRSKVIMARHGLGQAECSPCTTARSKARAAATA